VLLTFFGALACSTPPKKNAESRAAPATSTASTSAKSLPKIVAFGDSLTAGYGLAPDESYPSLLQKKLVADGYNYEVVNAGVSGDTSAGGLRRLDWALDGDVRIVILELGANDVLRGLPVQQMKDNLSQIIQRAKAKGAQVLVGGMEAPTNAGSEYRLATHGAFFEVARKEQVPLMPFFLEGVAGIESLNQQDGIHPNQEGTRIVADNVYRALLPLLDGHKGQ